jgi:hypothetical protein
MEEDEDCLTQLQTAVEQTKTACAALGAHVMTIVGAWSCLLDLAAPLLPGVRAVRELKEVTDRHASSIMQVPLHCGAVAWLDQWWVSRGARPERECTARLWNERSTILPSAVRRLFDSLLAFAQDASQDLEQVYSNSEAFKSSVPGHTIEQLLDRVVDSLAQVSVLEDASNRPQVSDAELAVMLAEFQAFESCISSMKPCIETLLCRASGFFDKAADCSRATLTLRDATLAAFDPVIDFSALRAEAKRLRRLHPRAASVKAQRARLVHALF